MELKFKERAAVAKSESKKLRREGFIPAVLYVRGKEGQTIAVNSNEFAGHIRHVKSGHLPTTIFSLIDEKGVTRRVVIKDIQYDIVTYAVKHLDFEELVEDHKINVKIPIECVGQEKSPGLKLGGVLRQVIRHVRVRCLPKDLPSFFELDLDGLGLRQSKRLSDIQIPETVRALTDLKEVVAVIVKR